MRQTLFIIPYEVGGVPLFGIGVLFWLWLAGTAIWAWITWRRGAQFGELAGSLISAGLVALMIAIVLPHVGIEGPDGELLGIPIRGYGVMLLAGIASGLGLSVLRGRRHGIASDTIVSLAFVMFVAGIVGARLFYVIQKWEQFRGESLVATVLGTLNFVQGGLVVYGSLVGAALGFLWFANRHGLPKLQLGDVIAPGMALGLCFGRIGCLLNGCCFGAASHAPWAVVFPEGSPPYFDQLADGQIWGFQMVEASGEVAISSVRPNSPAEAAGVEPGMRLVEISGRRVEHLQHAKELLAESGTQMVIGTGGTRPLTLVRERPTPSLPTEPTQIYSAINALLICLIALAYSPVARRPGAVVALVFTLYGISRFLLESVRVDEAPVWGTGMSISQNVSILLLLATAALWAYIWRQTPVAAGTVR